MATTIARGRYVLIRANLQGQSEVLEDSAVVQRDGTILESGLFTDIRRRYPDAEIVGNGRQFLIPGLVNAHHHGRGVSGLQMGQPDGALETWIQRGWGRRTLDPYLMAMYTLLQQVRGGTTTVMFNQSAGPVEIVRAEADATLRAFAEVGVRVAFSVAFRNQCFVVYGDDDAFLNSLPSDLAMGVRGVIDGTTFSFEDYLAITRELASVHRSSDRVRVLLSPQSYHWCDEETLGQIGEVARHDGLGIHMHLVETAYQRLYAERLHGGQTPARRLYDLGFLGPHVSLAHAVWVTRDDIDLLAETGT
ncbi:MAG: amidohydrolase family protein, partial [Chloroflexi bacterium]|nr:amidohydrolase family protein [Chloroflexota bacterium]